MVALLDQNIIDNVHHFFISQIVFYVIPYWNIFLTFIKKQMGKFMALWSIQNMAFSKIYNTTMNTSIVVVFITVLAFTRVRYCLNNVSCGSLIRSSCNDEETTICSPLLLLSFLSSHSYLLLLLYLHSPNWY